MGVGWGGVVSGRSIDNHLGAHTRDPPGRDNLDVRLEAVKCKLETDLIVPFASASMGNIAATSNERRTGQQK